MLRQQFPLFQTPLDVAHAYWKKLVKPGATVIDATCGNGHDTLVLAQLALGTQNEGKVIAIDIQQDALDATRQRLKQTLIQPQMERISFHQQCHSSFPEAIMESTVDLIVYNLGYLPGGNKGLTTISSTTLQSLQAAQRLLRPGGAISIMCYPGHAQGKEEEKAILDMTAALAPQEWSCCHHRWTNRNAAPSLLLLQRGI